MYVMLWIFSQWSLKFLIIIKKLKMINKDDNAPVELKGNL